MLTSETVEGNEQGGGRKEVEILFDGGKVGQPILRENDVKFCSRMKGTVAKEGSCYLKL